MELTSELPKDSTLNSACGLPPNMLSVLNFFEDAWTSDLLPELLSSLDDVCEMLPESEILQDVQSQLMHLHTSELPKDIIMDHLVRILQEILSQVIETQDYEIIDHLVGSIMAMLKMSESLSKKAPIILLLKKILSQVLNFSVVDYECEIPEKLMSLMEADPTNVPVNLIMDHSVKLWHYLHLLIESSTYPVVWIPRKLLLLILNLAKRLPDLQGSQKDLESYLFQILDHVSVITINETLDPVTVLREDLRPLMMFMEILTLALKTMTPSLVSEVREIFNLDPVSGTPRDFSSAQKYILGMTLSNETIILGIVSQIMSVCENLPENEVFKDLKSQLKYLHRILLFYDENLFPIDVVLDHFAGVLQDILLHVVKTKHVDGLHRYHLIDNVGASVKTLLVLSVIIPEMYSTKRLFEDMLLKVMNISRIESEKKMPKNLRLSIESKLDIEFLNLSSTVDRLSEIKWYLQSLMKARKGNKVLVPQNLLLLCQNVPNMVPKGFVQRELQKNITKILIPVILGSGSSPNEPVQNLVEVSQEDMGALLIDLDHLTGIPKNLILAFVLETSEDPYCNLGSNTTNDLLLLLKNISWAKWKLRALVLKLMDICKVLPESVSLINVQSRLMDVFKMFPSLPSQLVNTRRMDPAIGIPDGVFLPHLVEILGQITSLFILFNIKNQTSNKIIAEGLVRVGNALLALSVNLPKMSCVNQPLHDILSALSELSRVDPELGIIKSQVKVFENSHGADWSSNILKIYVLRLMEMCDMLPESESIIELRSQLVNISQHATGRQHNMDKVAEILVKLIPCIMEMKNVSGIQKCKIFESLNGTIKVLLFLSLMVRGVDTTNMGMTLKHTLSQIRNILSGMEPVSEISDSLQLLIERNPETQSIQHIMEHLLEIKCYIQSLVKSRTGPEVVVPRNLLLLSLIIAKTLPNKLQAHILNIQNSVSQTPENNPFGPVHIFAEDLSQLLINLEMLTMNPMKMNLGFASETSKDSTLAAASEVHDNWLSEVADQCLTDYKLKALVSELMNACKHFLESAFIKDLESELLDISKMLPEDLGTELLMGIRSKKSNDEIMDRLVEILDHLMLQACVGKSKSDILKFQILHDLDRIIRELLSLSISVSKTATRNNKLKNMLLNLWNTTRIDWASEKLKMWVILLMDVYRMLPESEPIKHLWSKLTKLYWMDPADEMILNNLVLIIEDLMSPVTALNSACSVPKNLMVHHLSWIIRDLLSTSLTAEHENLKEMLSVLMEIYRTVWTCNDLKIFVLQLIDVCKMLPANHLVVELHSQLINIVHWNHPASQIPKEVILDHLVGILQDIISQVGLIQINNTSRIHTDQIVDHLSGITQGLHSLSMNLSELAHINEIIKGMLSQVLNKFNMEHANQTLKRLAYRLTYLSKIVPENTSLQELLSRIMCISRMDPANTPIDIIEDSVVGTYNHIIAPQCSNIFGLADKKGVSPDQLIYLIDQIVKDTSSVMKGIYKSCMQMQEDMDKSNKDTFIEIPEKLQSFTEMDLESLATNMTPQCEIQNMIEPYLKELDDVTDTTDLSVRSWILEMQEDPTDLSKMQMRGLKVASLMLNLFMLRPKNVFYKYLVSLIRCPIGEISEEVSDPISGIPDDVLSLLVYSFFPSHLHINSGGRECPTSPYIEKHTESKTVSIKTGSRSEYLCLPAIVNKEDTKEPMYDSVLSDIDVMVDPGWFQDFYDTMSIEIYETRPVFCKIQHAIPLNNLPENTILDEELPLILKGNYLNSANINYLFWSYFVQRDPKTTRLPGLQETFKTSYDSAALSTKHVDMNPCLTISTDDVFCIPVRWNEDYKQDFLKRLKPNKWPLNSVANLDYLLTEQVYAIPKPDPNSEDGELRWRLSFSVIEVELARSLTDTQRRCYKLLKALVKYDVNEGLPEKNQFPSYYLKTAMFWFCESSTQESWKIENLGTQWLKLLDYVIASLEKRTLLMYFIPTYNFLDHKNAETFIQCKTRLTEIRETPLQSFRKFWSKYEVMNTYNPAPWGTEYDQALEVLDLFYTIIPVLKLGKTEDGQNEKLKTEVEISKLHLRWIFVYYHLAVYCLSDVLGFLNLFPQANELVPFANFMSKEHLIWQFYNQFLQFISLNEENVFDFAISLVHLAEVTHHMILKYRDNVPDRDLFSTQAVQKFYLIAASIQTEETFVNSTKYLKYANFLHTENLFEDCVQVLNICQKLPFWNRQRISRLTCEVLDDSLKLFVALQDEISCDQSLFVCHLAISCYIQAGVLAEVYIPEYFEKFSTDSRGIISFGTKKILHGFQFVLRGQLLEAFQTFNSIDDQSKLPLQILSHKLKYVGMLFIIAKMCSK